MNRFTCKHATARKRGMDVRPVIEFIHRILHLMSCSCVKGPQRTACQKSQRLEERPPPHPPVTRHTCMRLWRRCRWLSGPCLGRSFRGVPAPFPRSITSHAISHRTSTPCTVTVRTGQMPMFISGHGLHTPPHVLRTGISELRKSRSRERE